MNEVLTYRQNCECSVLSHTPCEKCQAEEEANDRACRIGTIMVIVAFAIMCVILNSQHKLW